MIGFLKTITICRQKKITCSSDPEFNVLNLKVDLEGTYPEEEFGEFDQMIKTLGSGHFLS